ncbi:MAG TPA: cytochrome ubiquinol oxidase subunit I [bacterium]|jgi:cytochrome d ubiquinol oxidase subunit I|nr:cytochrome ubiquinol oxidase subunit I [bacterium]
MSPETLHRFQFAFTITYHYLFPQLSMGLALLIVALKTRERFWGDAEAGKAAEFWTKIFGINFAFGVVTGIPMEFQFGTNWSRFSEAAGGVVGSTLAQEGVFAFILESSFLGLLVYGRKRIGPTLHWFSAVAVCLGAWISGYFITVTNAWMQHPVGSHVAPGGIVLDSLGAVLLNPWELWSYPHVMLGACLTGATVMASVGAYYLLERRHEDQARLYLRLGVGAGLLAGLALAFPTGDGLARTLSQDQPAAFAGMEALFHTQSGAPLAIIGQPDVQRQSLDNPIELPHMLSFLTYRSWGAPVQGLDKIPTGQWPPDIPLLYYAYHMMVGLGTGLIALMGLAALALWTGRLWGQRWLLWLILLAAPFPYIANTCGWLTSETGRQPWIIYGLMRTDQAFSPQVSSGNVLFSLLGFLGLYSLLSLLFLALIGGSLKRGPGSDGHGA